MILTSEVRVEQYGIQGGVKVFGRKFDNPKRKTTECMYCGHRKTYDSEAKALMQFGKRCNNCSGPTVLTYTREGEKPSLTIKPPRPVVSKKEDKALEIKVEVDTSELDAAIDKAKELQERLTKLQDKHKDDVLDPIANALKAIEHIQDKYGTDKKEKLLVIEMDDIHSVPRILHKGERIDMITSAHFEWNTDSKHPQPKSFHIEHYDKEDRCFKNIGSSK